jgi:AGCS family alanine or glycine:cation symporter
MAVYNNQEGNSMFLERLGIFVNSLNAFLWGWPLIAFISVTAMVFTVALGFIQFRSFFDAWRYLLRPEKGHAKASITPLQAFLNALSASLGNGSLTGMATAIYSGGPGAAFWVFILGFLSMPIRFAEVFCGTSVAVKLKDGSLRGGPIAYIQRAPGGSYLVYVYVFCMLWLTFASGCAMQCQSITAGLVNVTGVSAYIFAALLFTFLVYIMSGGAYRILHVADIIVPVKVLLFFIATTIALIYHAGHLWEAIQTIVAFAFRPEAMRGGIIGYTVQNAMRFGISRVSNATETGLGTAGILYGATGSSKPVQSGIMSMATTFISNLLVCFVLMLLIVASGAWSINEYGTEMTIAAYATVFGAWGGIVVTTLSLMFGLGVLVTYVFIGRECWAFLTNNRYFVAYAVIYCLFALFGALGSSSIVWNLVDIANAGLLAINLYALWLMIPEMRIALAKYRKHLA